MGVKGAAVATILSQAVSAVWVFLFEWKTDKTSYPKRILKKYSRRSFFRSWDLVWHHLS